MNNPNYIILHTLAFDGEADIHEVRRWHHKNGWNDVGYHYLIRRDGQLQTGRSETSTGAHCREQGMNRKSLGVAFEGHGDNQGWTEFQWRTLRLLFRFMNAKYQIDPAEVIGHREVEGVAKTCPGKLIDMDVVRKSLEHSLKRTPLV